MKKLPKARFCAAAVAGIVVLVSATGQTDADRLIRVSTSASRDSVTVGQRFHVRHVFEYPDSLKMLDITGPDAGNCRILSLTWKEKSSKNLIARTADLTLLTLDLEQARLPEIAADFEAPSGDTIRVFAGEVILPVRHIAPQGAEPEPLKDQWEAPRSLWKWVVLAFLAAVAAAAVVFWLRRRKTRVAAAAPEPKLPPDYVALTELTRIEKLELLADGQYKKYYSLITRTVRKYIEDRFSVDALDRTTRELLHELDAIGRRIDQLEGLLRDADLVKFAKHLPGRETAAAALNTARKIVASTAPKLAVGEQAADEKAAARRPPEERGVN